MNRESFIATMMVVLGALLLLRHRHAAKLSAYEQRGRAASPASTIADSPVHPEPDVISRGADLAERFYHWYHVLIAVMVLGALSYLAVTDTVTAGILGCTLVLMVIIYLLGSSVRDRAKRRDQPMP